MGQKQKKEMIKAATGLGRITRADREVKSNDSPEIPDRGRHQKCPAYLQASETILWIKSYII